VRASADRGRVLLVLLFALLTIAGATTPGATQGNAEQRQATVLGGLALDTPATHHDLRVPVAARHALSTPASDIWWAVCAPAAGAWAPRRRDLAGEVAGTAVAIGLAATPSTRAPPVRVN
jgi:hypothetical protein